VITPLIQINGSFGAAQEPCVWPAS